MIRLKNGRIIALFNSKTYALILIGIAETHIDGFSLLKPIIVTEIDDAVNSAVDVNSDNVVPGTAIKEVDIDELLRVTVKNA